MTEGVHVSDPTAHRIDRAEVLAVLTLAFAPNLGPVRIKGLLEHFGSGLAALRAPPTELREIARRKVVVGADTFARAEACLASCVDHGITPVAWSDPAFPIALRTIHDPPPVLFVRGTLPSGLMGEMHDLRAVAVVGTRDPTARARGYAVALGREIAAADVVVVSGLALGIDGAAHEGALEARRAHPVAVLAGGIEVVRPAAHTHLADRILAAGGALVSEDPPGLRPRAHRFVARNRLVSGLSRGVVVVEAGARSGALHTAEFALDQGREVFAVPDHPTATRALGNLRLLGQGAVPVTRPADVLESFGFRHTDSAAATPVPGEGLLVEVGRHGPCSLDQLGGEPLHNLVLLAELEIRNFVARDGAGRYRLTYEGRSVIERSVTEQEPIRKELDTEFSDG